MGDLQKVNEDEQSWTEFRDHLRDLRLMTEHMEQVFIENMRLFREYEEIRHD